MNDVQHLIVTTHMFSVQILKYSSLRFGCFLFCFLTMNYAGHLYREGLLLSFVFFKFTVVSKIPKVPKRCKSRNLWTVLLRISEISISTYPQWLSKIFIRLNIEMVKKNSTTISFTQENLKDYYLNSLKGNDSTLTKYVYN